MLVAPGNGRGTASIADHESTRLMLGANEPNSFSGSTRIRFALANASDLSVQIFDVGGRSVRSLFDGHLAAGQQEITWQGDLEDGRHTSAGMYFCRVTLPDGASQTQRLFLVR